MVQVSKRGWQLGLLFFFLVAVFHITSIQNRYMRDDEEIAFRTTSRDLSYTIWYQATQDVHAPVWFSSFWLWQQFIGDSEFMGRVYSVFATLLTLALVYQIGRTWFNSVRVGIFAIAILGVNAYFFTYGLEIRPYAVNVLVATVSMWCFYRWLKRRTLFSAVIYGLTVTVMLYQHYFLVFLVIAQALYLLFVARPNRQMLLQIIGAWLLAFLLWSPWFPVAIHQVKTLISIESSFGNERGVAGIGSTTEPTTLPAIVNLINLMTSGQPGLYLLLLLAGLVYYWRKANYRLVLLWAFAVPIVALLVNLVFAVYTPRYITYLTIGLALVLAVGITVLPRRLQWLTLIVFATISLWSLPSQFSLRRIPYRDFYQQMAKESQPGDVLYLDPLSPGDNVVWWQMAHYLPAQLAKTVTADMSQATTSRRIWFITTDWFNTDVHANFAKLEPNYPVQQVLGDCNRYWCYLLQLMEAPPLKTPKTFGTEMPFWGADVGAITHSAVDVHLWWRIEHPPTINYSIGLHLLDANGNLVSQVDGSINEYGKQTVDATTMQLGYIYIDFRTLNLPTTIAPGTYQLALIVYDWQTGKRLLLADGSDQLLLDKITIP
ncbi:MAG: glycosyltransferase family 39 protein [Anaerolineae bacterium]|nr:glycosyltransferase family 39 protein [Anaerolineae bacterium]